jgi:hypothetical protein
LGWFLWLGTAKSEHTGKKIPITAAFLGWFFVGGFGRRFVDNLRRLFRGGTFHLGIVT